MGAVLFLSFGIWLLSVLPLLSAPQQILVKPRPDVTAAALNRFHATRNGTVTRTFRTGRIQSVRVPPGQTAASLIAQYRQSGLVEFAEPDGAVRKAAAPDDPLFTDGTSWALENTGQFGGTPGADIRALEGWDIATSASNVVVAVLDTGIRCTHEDLAPNLWVNTNDLGHGWNAFTSTNDPADDEGHGTMVAGIIGAVGSNSLGMAGVAWQTQLMACKCLDSQGYGSNSTVIACLEYALTNGAHIIDASFTTWEYSEAISNVLASIRDAGIIVVAPAGNNDADVDQSPSYPACYDFDNIVSVTYTSQIDQLGHLANFGVTNVDLAAPGANIYSTLNTADDAYCPPDYPDIKTRGTSFGAAYVTGALALLREKYPAEDYRLIIERLLRGTDRIPALEGKCATGGRLNLRKALSPPVELLPLPGGSEPFQLRVSSGPNRTCIIEASPDLAVWTPVFTNSTSTNWTFDFTDDQSTHAAQTFYRAVLAP